MRVALSCSSPSSFFLSFCFLPLLRCLTHLIRGNADRRCISPQLLLLLLVVIFVIVDRGKITAVVKIIFGPSPLSVRPKAEMMQRGREGGGEKKSIRLQITLARAPPLLFFFLHDLPTFSHLIANCFSGMDAAAATASSAASVLRRNHIFTLGCGPPALTPPAAAIPPLQFECHCLLCHLSAVTIIIPYLMCMMLGLF